MNKASHSQVFIPTALPSPLPRPGSSERNYPKRDRSCCTSSVLSNENEYYCPRPCTFLYLSGGLIYTARDIQIPFYALISFACYLLARLGWAVMTFNDVPEAQESLQREIEIAKIELRKGKVDVD